MTPQELRDWRVRLNVTQSGAAMILGITLRGYQKREAGEAPIDREAELACRYLEEHPEEAERLGPRRHRFVIVPTPGRFAIVEFLNPGQNWPQKAIGNFETEEEAHAQIAQIFAAEAAGE